MGYNAKLPWHGFKKQSTKLTTNGLWYLMSEANQLKSMSTVNDGCNTKKQLKRRRWWFCFQFFLEKPFWIICCETFLTNHHSFRHFWVKPQPFDSKLTTFLARNSQCPTWSPSEEHPGSYKPMIVEVIYGGFRKWGYPPNHPFLNGIFHYKPATLVYHHLWKPLNNSYI